MHKNAQSRPINTATRADFCSRWQKPNVWHKVSRSRAGSKDSPVALGCVCSGTPPSQGHPSPWQRFQLPSRWHHLSRWLCSLWVNPFGAAFALPTAGRSLTMGSPHTVEVSVITEMLPLDVSEQWKNAFDKKKFKARLKKKNCFLLGWLVSFSQNAELLCHASDFCTKVRTWQVVQIKWPLKCITLISQSHHYALQTIKWAHHREVQSYFCFARSRSLICVVIVGYDCVEVDYGSTRTAEKLDRDKWDGVLEANMYYFAQILDI